MKQIYNIYLFIAQVSGQIVRNNNIIRKKFEECNNKSTQNEIIVIFFSTVP